MAPARGAALLAMQRNSIKKELEASSLGPAFVLQPCKQTAGKELVSGIFLAHHKPHSKHSDQRYRKKSIIRFSATFPNILMEPYGCREVPASTESASNSPSVIDEAGTFAGGRAFFRAVFITATCALGIFIIATSLESSANISRFVQSDGG